MNNDITCMEIPEFRKKISSRLNRIDGQIRGIEKMILNGVVCDEILNQISSVKSALNGIARIVLETHLRSCVVHNIKSGMEDMMVEELITTVDIFMSKNNMGVIKNTDELISKVEKQIAKMRESIERDECCSSVLKEIACVKDELDTVSKSILKKHIENSLISRIKDGEEERVIDEFLYTVNKMVK